MSPGHPKLMMSFWEANPGYPRNCPNMALQILSTQSHSACCSNNSNVAPSFISRGETTENQTIKNLPVGSHSPNMPRLRSYKISRGKKNGFFLIFPKELALRGKVVQDRLCTWLSQVDREHGVHKPSAVWR